MHSIANRCVDTPFCDYLSFTAPEGEAHSLDQSLRPLMLEAGSVPEYGGFRFPVSGGFCKVQQFRQIVRWSLSGEVVNDLREAGLWASVLAEVGAHPHRITRLDIALDTADDGPVVVPALEAKAWRGDLRLSRKAISGEDTHWNRHLGPCGRPTGSFYTGKRGKVGVLGRAYDKRAHIVQKLGQEDPGVSWTRYELELSMPGISLADAYAPERLFWAYGPGLCGRPVPEGVESWEAHGAGYVLPPRRERSLYEALATRVENCAELDALRGMADAMGEPGLMALRRMVLQRLGLDRNPESLTAVAQ